MSSKVTRREDGADASMRDILGHALEARPPVRARTALAHVFT
ncbi:hypothetical protein [Archangium lansingense]|uniref:Uncharacterized protein n=1 Tax=Archangium lansingense TaxID=2995310 RepID=A0ABT4A998_9BACT|nr:hypothetical protein [Archangium lansinium]MCY1077824.1 hypothetical protein [Archangium lansinium]